MQRLAWEGERTNANPMDRVDKPKVTKKAKQFFDDADDLMHITGRKTYDMVREYTEARASPAPTTPTPASAQATASSGFGRKS